MAFFLRNRTLNFFMIVITMLTITPVLTSADSIDSPTTGFEDSGGEEWTTLEDEIEFINEIAENSDRVSISERGSSVNGNPVHLIKIGYPEAPTDEDLEDERNMLIMGTPHGNEPAARDLSLKLLRELAFTDDEDRIDLLEKSNIMLLPTPNPDGRDANVRTNEWGIDNNRDNLNLNTPENQTLAKILNQFDPDIVVDAHERPTGTSPDVEMLYPRNLNVDQDLRELNIEMVDDYIMPDVEADGFSTDHYGSPDGAGSGDERILRNLGGLRHSLTLLTESAGAVEKVDRVDMQESIINSAINFYTERFDDIGKIVEEAPEKKQQEGKEAKEPYYLEGRDDNNDSIRTMDPPACGYLLHEKQAEKIEKHIDLFSIETEEVGNQGVFISMDQPMMTVIPMLVDKDALYNEVDATALDDCSELGSVTPSYKPSNNANIKQLDVILDGDNELDFNAKENKFTLETTEKSASIKAESDHKHAEIQLDGTHFGENRAVDLEKGGNTFEIIVTAENGSDQNTYQITINRSEKTSFDDVEGHWAEEYIAEAHENEWFKGYSDNTFRPDDKLKRMQTASLFVRVLDLKNSDVVPFKDLNGIASETLEELEKAYGNNIIRGYENNTFKPYKNISRAQVALIISRVYEEETGSAYKPDKETSFPDIGHYDKETQRAILTLKELEIVDGDDGEFKPDDSTTRAHAAKMLKNMNEVVKDQ